MSYRDHGRYATDIFTKESETIIKKHNIKKPLFLYLSHIAVHSGNQNSPLEKQAPKSSVDKHKYIKDKDRRLFSGILHKLDESVGKVQIGILDHNLVC